MSVKICKKCKIEQPLENYGKTSFVLKNGLLSIYIRHVCKKCSLKDNRERNKKTGYWKKRYWDMSPEEKQTYIEKKSAQNLKRENIKEIRKTYNNSDKGIYKQYINECKRRGKLKRGITMQLTFEQFAKLINSNCEYCDEPNARGVDRIDFTKSYTIENSAPCCEICNRLKLDHSVEELKNHMIKILKNLENKGK
jgi:hypothetical protein